MTSPSLYVLTSPFLSLNVVDADLAREEAKRRQDAVRRWIHGLLVLLVLAFLSKSVVFFICLGAECKVGAYRVRVQGL